jgi:hypothetical protein
VGHPGSTLGWTSAMVDVAPYGCHESEAEAGVNGLTLLYRLQNGLIWFSPSITTERLILATERLALVTGQRTAAI